jgi:MFS family permease
VGCISSFFYGRIKSFLGRKNTIILSYLIIGIMCVLLSFFVELFILIPVLALLGFSLFITYPALASFVSEETHETVEGKTFGLIFTLQLGGGTLLLFIDGFLADIFGIWIPFTMLGFLSLLLAFILLLNYKQPFVK